MDAADEPFTFFIDRGIGSRVVPDALRDAGWSIVTMDERYGSARSQQMSDVDWIAEASRRGEVSICKDTAIARNYDEARTIYMHDARVFAFSLKYLTGPQMAGLLLRWQAQIWSIARRAKGPFVFAISQNRPRRCRLHYPGDMNN